MAGRCDGVADHTDQLHTRHNEQSETHTHAHAHTSHSVGCTVKPVKATTLIRRTPAPEYHYNQDQGQMTLDMEPTCTRQPQFEGPLSGRLRQVSPKPSFRGMISTRVYENQRLLEGLLRSKWPPIIVHTCNDCASHSTLKPVTKDHSD